MADYVPVYADSESTFTLTTSAAVTGGRLLSFSADSTVAHAAAADSKVVGVAAFDAAAGARVTVWPIEGVIHELEANAAITAGSAVVAAGTAPNDGRIATAGAGTAATETTLQPVVGMALNAAAGAGSKVRVLGRR